MKPHLIPIGGECSWPGAMTFRVKLPCGQQHYLTVDSWAKVDQYLAKWRIDPNYPAGIDLG
jgi:hypothetical protein